MKNLNVEEHKKRIERIIILSTFFIGYLYIYLPGNALYKI